MPRSGIVRLWVTARASAAIARAVIDVVAGEVAEGRPEVSMERE